MRKTLAELQGKVIDGCRVRGESVTRVEAIADATLGFAIALLAVSEGVPKDYKELLDAMRGLPAFGACLMILGAIWYEHHRFSRRYGLETTKVRMLTLALVFLVLAYIYPLKFLSLLFFNRVLGLDRAHMVVIATADIRWLFVIYGVGFVAVNVVQALMYLHAYQLREELQLNAREIMETRFSILDQVAGTIPPLISIAVAQAVPTNQVGLAGYVYVLVGVTALMVGTARGRARRQMLASAPSTG
jgi:uncharacterized membrane protein